MPVRETFWNIPFEIQIGFYAASVIATLIFAWGVKLSFDLYAKGPKKRQGGNFATRFKTLWQDIFLQRRILKRPAGILHAAIFFTFVLLFIGTALATLDWDLAKPLGLRLLAGKTYLIYKVVLEIAGVTAIAAVGLSLVRRFGLMTKRDKKPGIFCLMVFLLFILISGFFLEALRVAALNPDWAYLTPVGLFIADTLLDGLSLDALSTLHVWTWLIHGVAGLVCVALIPFTFLEHVYKVPVSVFWRRLTAKGFLEIIPDMEEAEAFGLSKVSQMTDTQRIMVSACTGCARCTDVCPALAAGAPLDPRRLVEGLKNALASGEDTNLEAFVSREALKTCSTCGACYQACPARIDIPTLVVELRRHLALEEGDFDAGVRTAIEASTSVGNPFGMAPSTRFDWAKDLDVPFAREGDFYDILFWVGCQASLDTRARDIARAMVKILRAAGVNFAVMAEERCLEDFARRAGEEYVFVTAAEENIANLKKYRFRHLLTTCPHCFNTLKNEYPALGGDFSVVHHTTFIAQMIDSGRLKLKTGVPLGTIAIHDPCYLARYNDSTGSIRKALDAIDGTRRAEVTNR
ncbi:MAG TPA: hypothetical protein DCW60_04265, partial [Sutterella sp.]|nr:hypothetical protein [Sutterella sp.]